ncbi:Protein of unknown function [Gryllus bimaculatus]|nr:Protein of unknown function [Gryllus bimaculatus]
MKKKIVQLLPLLILLPKELNLTLLWTKLEKHLCILQQDTLVLMQLKGYSMLVLMLIHKITQDGHHCMRQLQQMQWVSSRFYFEIELQT